MYTLTTPLATIKGIGPRLSLVLANRQLYTVKDLLFFIPLRYEDRSVRKTIAALIPDELVTLEVEVLTTSNYYKGRRSIQSAQVKDATGKLKLMWFNNPHLVSGLVKGKQYLVSGKLNDRGMMVQPTIEVLKADSIHTGRLVPIYSSIQNFPPATLRRILKHIIDHLDPVSDVVAELMNSTTIMPLSAAFRHIHFPDSSELVVQARERFALEELLALIRHSQQLKQHWKELGQAVVIATESEATHSHINQLPFPLTRAQLRCIDEILGDLQSTVPMNRLLIGDVGSGKTAVAGVACAQVVAQGASACLVAPTQILAEQHVATLHRLFPHLSIELVTSKQKPAMPPAPCVYVGTHAVLNLLHSIKPALLIYDEQHRFGVMHRSMAQHLQPHPHILTLSATPIPRTLMLTLFSHLSLSVIDELPPGRQPVKTWLVPERKRADGYHWIFEHVLANQAQALIVCPFIDPSASEALENVAAASEMYKTIQSATAEYLDSLPTERAAGNNTGDPQLQKKQPPKLQTALLHGRMSKKEQAEITDHLYQREVDILVSTPIIEVGVDLPSASIIVIEAAERFGLASLHQLRGRVGRAGQAAFCLLFTTSHQKATLERLKKFCELHDGIKLAEMDLEYRGAGDLFGVQQHGFDDLQFANWSNLELITQAKQVSEQLFRQHPKWASLIQLHTTEEGIPLAN